MPSIKLFVKATAAIVILFVAFGPLGVLQQTPVAHAAGCTQTQLLAGGKTITIQGETTCSVNGSFVDQNGKPTSIGGDTSCTGITSCLAWTIYWIGPGFASWVASISAYFFDYIVKISLNSTAYALGFLTTSWGIVLNLANMFFIFILIYAAFTIMLRAETARTMQILAWVIAIALVVNFSFFFTRIVIDAGNILATQFYNGIVAQPNIAGVNLSGTTDANAPVDITRGIMQALGIEKPLTQQGFTNWQAATGNTNSAWSGLLVLTVVFLSTAILFWMLAFGLIMIAVKFLVRVVGLWLTLIASPLAFVSKTLPKTQHFFEMWLKTLVGFSFYPAIFLFMFYVLNMFVKDLGNSVLFSALSSNQNSAQNIASGAMSPGPLISQLADVFIRMGFLIVMMYIMLKAADWLMEQTGGMAGTFMNKMSGALISGGFRTASTVGAFAGRNTVGRGAFRLADTAAFKKFAGSSAIGNALWRGTSGISKATFDVRNAPGGSVLKKGISAVTGNIDIGKATAKSFDKAVTEREKQVKQRAEALKSSETEKRNAQEKYQREHGEDFRNQTVEHNAGALLRNQEIERLKASRATHIEHATDKNARTPFDDQINKLEREQKEAREAQIKREKEFAEGGKKVSEAAQKERITALANRIGTRNFRNLGMPSAGSVRGAVAAMKLIKEKSIEDKFKDLVKETSKEESAPTTTTTSSAPTAVAPHVVGGGSGSAFSRAEQNSIQERQLHVQEEMLRKTKENLRLTQEGFSKLDHDLRANAHSEMRPMPKIPSAAEIAEEAAKFNTVKPTNKPPEEKK